MIIAEEITSRFMNVISLFNGAIPLIAYQVTATKVGDEVNLNFVKVLDRVTLGTDEENESEPTNRAYWEGKSDQMPLVDLVFKDVLEYASDYELKYNKHFIGMARKNGAAANFIYFKAKKQYVWLFIKENEEVDVTEALENTGLEADYIGRSRGYRIKISKPTDYQGNKEIITDMIHKAMDYKNIDY